MSEKVYCGNCRYFKKKKFYLDCRCLNINNYKNTWEKKEQGIPEKINENNDCAWYIQK